MWDDILSSSVVMLLFVILMLAIYYLISARGMKERKERSDKLHAELMEGHLVRFAHGIYGTIVAIGEETVDIRVKSGAVMTVSRHAIAAIVEEESLK